MQKETVWEVCQDVRRKGSFLEVRMIEGDCLGGTSGWQKEGICLGGQNEEGDCLEGTAGTQDGRMKGSV